MVQNRLAQETSPYLRQHADNPVDWYPWGEEAFTAARERDVPVVLSVGYSACHWCHVMAHESFESPAVAEVMNRLFVSVKVDREERPDVDAVYMEAVQAMSGHGGWPMTVFLTPDGRPFFGGTYFPPEPRGGMPGFVQVLEAVEDAWRNRRSEVLAQADQLSTSLAAHAGLPADAGVLSLESGDRPPSADPAVLGQVLDAAYRNLRQAHDDSWGGFGQAPKFPQPTMVDLMIRAYSHNRSPDTLAMITTTLDAMASGGIYDHLGGGFARYSVDRHWLVPHFEKMLYDQAGLARVYLHAWQLTGERRWLQVVEETLDYVRRDLAAAGGGFASAEDADSEGEEGRFYLWTADELRRLLEPELAAAAIDWWGVSDAGNFEGRSILHRPVRGDLLRPAPVDQARRVLLDLRSRRVRPGLDDKVLTEWNAMVCSVLAEAGAAAGRPDWVRSAADTADFLLRSLRADGRWMRSWQGGRARHLAYAADYAWLVEAFVRLAEATGAQRWVQEACRAADELVRLFWDPDDPGFFTTGADAERLIVRSKDHFDGATPSANSVAVNALLRLEALTGSTAYGDRARLVLDRLLPFAASNTTVFTHALAAVDLLAHGVTEVVVAGDRPDLVGEVHRRYLPNAVLAWGERGAGPLWEGRQDGAAYVCRHYACLTPAGTVDELAAQLQGS
ncbi:MAG TPA: thioredoxin domain-containing protein [Acidimicrobiales bacterium]|nr:thioredoxin domain-containing protein [Acidimicrobiales bacterium]